MKTYGIRDLCERFAVGEHTVLAWIRLGDLRAIDVSRIRGRRPKWRVSAEALAEFEAARTPAPSPPQPRQKKQAADVITFYR
jgi:hypothetical protein